MHGSQLIVKEKKKLITFVFHETEGSSPKTPTRLKKFKNDEALRKQRLLIKNIQVLPHNQAPYNFRTWRNQKKISKTEQAELIN